MARPSKSIERRGEILAAFERCVIERGFERTTLANVAEEAGLPRSLVRHFIGNRDEMTKALIDRLLERAQGQIDAQDRGMSEHGRSKALIPERIARRAVQ